MISGQINMDFIFMLIAAIMPWLPEAKEENDVQYYFTQSDSSYSFYGSFKIMADPGCLLEISFNFEHIRALAMDAKEVLLIDSGNDWNQVSYTYRKYIFFENTTTWHRKLDREKQRVDFNLVSSENNLAIIPRLCSSSGFYQVKEEGEEVSVEYYQQCQLERSSLDRAYLNRVKQEAVIFLKAFSEYAQVHCGHKTLSPE